MNVLNIFTNTKIVIYKGCDNLCVYSNDAMYFFIHFFILQVHRCGKGGSMPGCHGAGPGSIPGRDKFPV